MTAPQRTISQAFRCFDEVSRSGSLRRAAEVLHLTAAAVHQQVKNLEEQVGTPLFDRLPRGMQLTTAGGIVLAAVRRGQRDFEQALSQVEDLRSLRRGHIDLAVTQSAAERLVPAAIAEATKRYPGISYSVRIGSGEQILGWLADGQADLGHCLRRPPPRGVEEVRAWPQALGAVVARKHPLAQLGRAPRLRDCLEHPLLLMSTGTELRAMFDRLDPRQRLRLRPLVETSSVAMVRHLAATGVGVGFLIPENVAADVASRRLAWLGLADAGAGSVVCLYQRIGQTTSVATSMFMQRLDAETQAQQARFESA